MTKRTSSGADRRADVRRLLHEVGVDGEAAGGVDDDDVVLLGAGLLDAHPRDGDGVAERPGALAGVEHGVVAAHVAALGREDGHAGALADDLELGDGVGALEVGGDEERRVPLVLEPLAELAGEGRLAGALQAGEHDDRRRLLGEADRARLPAEDRDELLLHDLDDLLGGVERLADLGAEGALAHRAGEPLDDGQRDVGVEQGEADVADRRVDVGLRRAGPCRAGS